MFGVTFHQVSPQYIFFPFKGAPETNTIQLKLKGQKAALAAIIKGKASGKIAFLDVFLRKKLLAVSQGYGIVAFYYIEY